VAILLEAKRDAAGPSCGRGAGENSWRVYDKDEEGGQGNRGGHGGRLTLARRASYHE